MKTILECYIINNDYDFNKDRLIYSIYDDIKKWPIAFTLDFDRDKAIVIVQVTEQTYGDCKLLLNMFKSSLKDKFHKRIVKCADYRCEIDIKRKEEE